MGLRKHTCEIKLFWPLQECPNYFKIISATVNMLENIHADKPVK